MTMDLVNIRRTLHSIPEIGFCEEKTAHFLAELLSSFGLEVTRGIAGTGLVATLQRGTHPLKLGLRAELDGLPMDEPPDCSYKSNHSGRMHGCGHDGHMTMLIGAAQSMAADPNFNGTVHFIFQPAEENLGGAKRMIEDGLFDRFPCDMIFGLHNMPGIPAGTFSGKTGPLMASIDAAQISIYGTGGHGAQPEQTIDPILIAASLVCALQSVISRNLNPLKSGVVTVGSFHSGSSSNIIPDLATLDISLRATDPDSRVQIIERVKTLCHAISTGFGGRSEIEWQPGYPVLQNHQNAFELVQQVVAQTFDSSLELMSDPVMISEDFAFMLEQVPGAFLFIGNGDSAPLHNTSYIFNEQIIPIGVKFYQSLATEFFTQKTSIFSS
jgi:hippurate hydrolase